VSDRRDTFPSFEKSIYADKSVSDEEVWREKLE